MTRKGQFSVIAIIFWAFVLAVVLFVFGFFFIKAQGFVEDSAQAEDKAVDWEAGYLALSLAQQPITVGGDTVPLGEFLSRYPRDVHGALIGATLEQFVQETVLPEGVVRAAVVAADKQLVCPGGSWEEASGVLGGNRMCHITSNPSAFTDLSALIASMREEYDAEGGLGIVVLPSDPESVIVVVVDR